MLDVDSVVLSRLRHILMSYRSLRSSEGGGRYSWKELAGDISEYCDEPIPSNSLENFVRGWDEDQSKKKKSAADSPRPRFIHKYSRPEPERLEAIIEFLTNPDSKGYFCEKAVLLASSQSQAPYFLQHYLDDESGPDDFYNLDRFKADFQCRYLWAEDDRPYDIYVHILVPLANRAAYVDVVKQSTPPAADYVRAEKLMPDEPDLYRGWCVHSKTQNLFIFAKHPRTRLTLFYLALGYGGRTSRHPFPDQLVLLEHVQPTPEFGEESDSGYPNTLEKIREDLLEGLFVMALESS